MKLTFWGCDDPTCEEKLTTEVSVDFGIAGWYMNEEKETYCREHKPLAQIVAGEIGIEQGEIQKRVVEALLSHE